MVPWYLIACSLISRPGIQRLLCLLVTPIAVILQITIIMVREGGREQWEESRAANETSRWFWQYLERALTSRRTVIKEVKILKACRQCRCLLYPNIVKFCKVSLTPPGWAREDVGLVPLPPMSRVTRPSHGCHEPLRDRAAAAGRQSNWLLMITLSGLRKLLAWLFLI